MEKTYCLNSYLKLVNNALTTAVPECEYGESVVIDAMNYSLANGGKRIRPVLVLEFCRICGGDVKSALPLAVAIEQIHTYSLIHDDLPCMDNDSMRRGKPSCHIAFGESYALLAGDGLLTQAFATISQSSFAKEYPERAVKAVEVLSTLSGCNGMIGGQTIDLKSEGKEISLNTLKKMDELKTGALIKAACVLGVIAAGGKSAQVTAAEAFAENLGQAFQVVDDILDVTANEEALGKPIGSDAASGKSTYVTLLGLEKSKEIAAQLTQKAVESLSIFGKEADFLKNLALSLVNRDR